MTSRLQPRHVASSSARHVAVKASMRVVGYCRRSKSKQELSLEAQRLVLEQWACEAKLELAIVHIDDNVSGGEDAWRSEIVDGEVITRLSLAHRPGLRAAISDVHRLQARHLLAYKRDRFLRDVEGMRTLARLIEPATIRMTDLVLPDDFMGRFVATQIDALAELERHQIRDRTKRALAVKRPLGQRIGTVPFGYRLAADGSHSTACKSPADCQGCSSLEPHPDEHEAVDAIRRLHGEGLGRRKICAELERLGFNPRGAGWHPATVGRVLERLENKST